MPSVFALDAAHPTRAGQRGMTPSGKRWSRQFHEEMAAEEVAYIKRTLRWGGGHARGCSSEGVYTVSKLNKAIARARCHLASIGPQEGKRTRRLWGMVGRAQKQVDRVTNDLAKCLLDR